jgi:hypothetical protein
LTLMGLFDAAVLTANVYGRFDEKRYLTKATLVLEVLWLSIYRCMHRINPVNTSSTRSRMTFRMIMVTAASWKAQSEVNLLIHGACAL